MKKALIWASLAVASIAMPGHCHAQQWSSMDDLYKDLSHFSAIVSGDAGGNDPARDASSFGASGYLSGIVTGMAVAKWNQGQKTPCLSPEWNPLSLDRQVLALMDSDPKWHKGHPQFVAPIMVMQIYPCLK
jgi:hypothetical protein